MLFPAFLLLSQCFLKLSPSGLLKVEIAWQRIELSDNCLMFQTLNATINISFSISAFNAQIYTFLEIISHIISTPLAAFYHKDHQNSQSDLVQCCLPNVGNQHFLFFPLNVLQYPMSLGWYGKGINKDIYLPQTTFPPCVTRPNSLMLTCIQKHDWSLTLHLICQF